MNETLILTLAGLAGLALGTMFFGGLWWTIRKAIASEKPALWFLGSLLLRMGVALAGFYFISGCDLKRMLSCLIGFFIARLLVTRLTRPSVDNRIPVAQEAHHAT
jgi:F1F0 ATPase subunit 2